MTIIIEADLEPGFDFPFEKVAREVVNMSLECEEFPYEAEVSLTLVDNDTIHEINRENRNIDAPTDVLSFPMLDYDGPGDFDSIEDQVEFTANPETGEVLLGDIVISVDKVKEQALEYGHTLKREYAFIGSILPSLSLILSHKSIIYTSLFFSPSNCFIS